AGPILYYTWQSGWEFGGTFEIARLFIGGGEAHSDLSNTALKKGSVILSHSVFEIYLRKWF
ncbi:MAG: hypothetical protein ONA90_10100, partial [candidate division KSB1 bacterium]|nr:hypothetical protein [candidate division KSB1 bacterium]